MSVTESAYFTEYYSKLFFEGAVAEGWHFGLVRFDYGSDDNLAEIEGDWYERILFEGPAREYVFSVPRDLSGRVPVYAVGMFDTGEKGTGHLMWYRMLHDGYRGLGPGESVTLMF